jgi:hypothetical protein
MMTHNVLPEFKRLFEERYKRISVFNLKEDSVRYDFYIALLTKLQLEPWQIQLEQPLDPRTFAPRLNEKRKRDEQPVVDLSVAIGSEQVHVEFGVFKRNRIDKSPSNDTEYAFKILNDMMRLGLQSHITRSSGYFVCIADESMLGKRLGRTRLPAFPASEYIFDSNKLSEIMAAYKSAKRIDDRFRKKLEETGITIRAKLVFDQHLVSSLNPMTTKALAWEVTSHIP